MRKMQLAMVITVAVITLAVCVNANALGKKRPKRSRAKTASSKQVTVTVPWVFAAPVAGQANTSSRLPASSPATSAVTSAAVPIGDSANSLTPTIESSKVLGVPTQNVASAGQLVISEFRVRGPNGANDEFIEIMNVSGSDHTVSALSGTGYGVAASDGVTRCSIPNGTVIPNRGHYLCVNSVGYSIASYAAGNGTTATGDATYNADIRDK